jgi:hypothetical protein
LVQWLVLKSLDDTDPELWGGRLSTQTVDSKQAGTCHGRGRSADLSISVLFAVTAGEIEID